MASQHSSVSEMGWSQRLNSFLEALKKKQFSGSVKRSYKKKANYKLCKLAADIWKAKTVVIQIRVMVDSDFQTNYINFLTARSNLY